MGRQRLDESDQVSFPIVTEAPVSWGGRGAVRDAEGYKAIVNQDSGRVFSIVSKSYRLVRHESAVREVEKAISRRRDLGDFKTFTELYAEGGRIRITYRFPEIGVEISKGDLINLELHVLNSYDRSWPFIILLGAFRYVCANGLVVGVKGTLFQC